MANLEADKAAVPSLKEPAPLPAPTKEPSRASSLLWTGESHTSKEIYTNVPGPSKQNQACHPQVEDAVIEEPNTPSLSPSAAWPTSPPTSKPNAALSARAPLQESPNLLSLRRDEKTETRTEPTNDHSLLTTLAHGRPAEVGPVSSAAIGHASAPAVVGSSQDLYGPQHVHFETPPPGYRYPYPNLQAPPPSPDPYYRAQQPMEPFLYYHEPVRGYAGFPHPDYGPMFDGQRESTYPYTGYNEQRKPPSTGYQDRAYDPPNPFAPRPVCTIRDTYIPISRRSRRISPPRRSWPTGPRTETMKNDFRSRFRAPGSPTTTISSDTDSEDSDFDVKGTTRIERRRPSRPPQSRATCLDEKLDKAASYLGGVEGRSKDSFFKPNTSEPATTLPPRYAVSRLSSSSAQTASTARSTNASSSKASRSTRSSTAVFSTALSGVSSITSFDSEEEGDKRDSGGRSVMGDGQDEENGKNSDPLSISIGDQGGKEQEEEPKLKFPKLTRVVVKSGSGNMVVKFGGSNTYLEGAAECSFMTAENGAMFEDSIVGTDTEDPLISFESAAEDTKETSLMDAIDSFAYLVTEEGSDKYGTGFVDSEQDFENETKRRESIRRGKQPEVSLAKDITSQQDYSSTARHQVPSGVLSFSNMVGHKLVPTPGSSLCAQDSFDDLDSGQGPEKRHFGRKAVTFDPYSSEDLDIFSDYMHGGTRYSKNGFQDHPSAMPQETGYTSATSDLEQRNFRQDKFSPLTPSRHPTPKPRGVTQEPRNNQGTHVYECIIRGCPEYFDQADLLAKHSYQQ
ncbi:hypothetical protein BKA61DRAFT_359878 [Leptodontidium sp. MPI-SDFR-AT-0119]|nr:hypothetical protein BKA61DRAFT_359878 [Leptodontidium sp. MPI-SDFR-AT-0119]